jgi:5,10-methylenetetrahydromethanopterin reductase
VRSEQDGALLGASIGAVFPAHATPETLPAFAGTAEALGYEEVWVVEDCFLSGGLTLATAALAATERLRVGVGLLPAAGRNAAIAAMEIATVARLHPGRLTVAFGHGVEAWMRQINARPPRRLAALGEVTTAVRMLLAGETVDARGSLVTLASVALDNPPAVVPSILVGTTGPKGIALAGRRADGLLLPEGCGPRFIAHARQIMRTATQPRLHPPEMVVYAWLRLGEDERARSELADAVSHWIASGLYPGPMREAGIDASPPSGPVAREAADELAIVGTARQCADGVARFVNSGAQRLILAAVGADFVDQYTRFAEEVVPLLSTTATRAL